METQKTVAEGAGAASVAAAMFGKVDTAKKTVCLVSGGNIDVSILSRVITKGLTKTGRITEITTKVTDKPGQLTTLLQLVAGTGANIIGISHNREDEKSEINSCVVSMTLETRNTAHVEEIHETLVKSGYALLSH
jgi:threonine dehydratase